jgi:dolichol-phosphate mannosyltransferase
MAVASQSDEVQRVIAAPTGPLIVSPLIVSKAAEAIAMPALSLVVPTLNERDNIAGFLAAVKVNLDAVLPRDYEVIVVDDDSADRTWEIAAALMPEFPELRVVRRQKEGGLAVAVMRGWQVARGRMLGTINADFQHPPDVLPRLVERSHGADLTIATRHSDGGGLGDWGILRRLSSWGAARIGRWLLPEVYARVSDPLSGCYLVRREAIESTELRPLGYKSLMEILVRGRVGEIHECGYEMSRRLRGQSKVRAVHPLHFLRHLIRLRAAVQVLKRTR